MKLTSDKAKEMGEKSSRKGVPNKTTKEIRDIFQYIIEDNLDKIQDDLDGLEPMARLRVIIEMSKFVIPTLKATDINLPLKAAYNMPDLPDIGDRKSLNISFIEQ